MDKFRREIKVETIKAAKDKASYLLEAIGQKAGRALWVQEYESPIYRPYYANASPMLLK
jgi:uncharacterized protein YggE